MRKLNVRSGSGLGDAIYLQSVCRHLVEKGQPVNAVCNWPDVFRPLIKTGMCTVSQFQRSNVDVLAHYTDRKRFGSTTQFQDCCINAGIRTEYVDLRLDWEEVSPNFRWAGIPTIVVMMARKPFARKDGFGMELLPNCKFIQKAINKLRGRAHIVLAGHGESLFKFDGIDTDLTNKTSVCDMIDLAWNAHGFLGYPSFFIPLSESFNKPSLIVWSIKGLRSRNPFINTIKPKKAFHKPTSRHVVDDSTDEKLTEAVDALLNAATSPRAV